jgi:hypothetical protein
VAFCMYSRVLILFTVGAGSLCGWGWFFVERRVGSLRLDLRIGGGWLFIQHEVVLCTTGALCITGGGFFVHHVKDSLYSKRKFLYTWALCGLAGWFF